ncbi:ATP-binding cassette domain-containing protein [Aquabacterium sp.]|uniref:ATP-binding cassette domain-containing protein n=1 Tax=Aquabacterium sp. TaxID=1872578 RepID=UPI002CFFEC69|nr:ATP-binding cassette domain-containing protein [Aquabacterium sp.]HSW08145.1 ATP-binding cassette domain-containing protein [Aquabacterium sp.]
MNPLVLELNGAALLADEAPRQTHAAPLQRTALSPPVRGLPLSLRGISKAYGERPVLRDVNLSIAPGEFVAIVGRSGCGKSTLLRLLAQLEPADSGRIDADGQQPLAAQRDDIRIMFQDARLLPWKRVVDNVALGLAGRSARERATEALSQVGLADRAGDWPAVLSGGQRQRVALARALVHAPRLLLLDEPLGALDALTRIEMHQLIESLWRQHGFTALLVTHDVGEAVALADRVLLIEDHRVTLDQRIALPRPRSHAGAAFARYEAEILQRVLQQPAPAPEPEPAAWQASALRFAL